MSNNLIEISNLTKRYGNFTALNDVSLSLPTGKIIGLLGPNGSGKTTLIKLLSNLLMQYQGSILINGHKPGIETKKIVSYLPDRNYLPDKWVVKDAITYFKDFYDDFDEEKANRLIANLAVDPYKRFKTLSKGTKEKVQLCLVLSRNAKLYLFDEPIAGIDPVARDYIFDLILENYNKESTLIISTHLITDVERILDYTVFLKNGSVILSGDTKTLLEKSGTSLNEMFKEVFKHA